MTGLRTVGGGLPGPYTVTTNLCTNPDFRDVTGATSDVRKNLAPNPGNEAAGVNWLSNNGTVTTHSLDTTVKRSGSQSLKSTPATTNTRTELLSAYNVGGSPLPAVAPGDTITASVYVAHNAAATARGYVQIQFVDTPGTTVLQTTNGTTTTGIVGNSAFSTRLSLTATAPASAAMVRVLVFLFRETGFTQTGEVAWADDCLIERTVRLDPYFDGSTAAAAGLTYAWTGTTNASASVARGLQIRNTPAARSFAYRLDPSGGLVHRPNELNYASTDVYTSPGGDIGAFQQGMQPGKTYTFSAEGMASAADAGEAATGRRAVIFWRKSDGNYASLASPQVPVGTMTRVSVTATIPADATEAFLRLYNGSNSRDMTWQNILLQEGSSASPYFDGVTMEDDTTHYRWTGTVDGSTSEKITRLPFSAFAPDGTTLATMQKVLKRTNVVPNPNFRSSNTSNVVRTNLAWSGATTWWAQSHPAGGTWGPLTVVPSGAPDDNGAYLTQTMTTDATGSGGGIVLGSTTTNVLPVVAGQTYSARVLVRHSGAYNYYLLLRFYDAASAQVGDNSAIQTLAVNPTTWTEFKVTGLAPTGAVRAFISLYRGSPATPSFVTGDWLQVAGAQLEATGAVLPYFNGNYATDSATGWTYAWTGTAGASPSTWTAPLRANGNMQGYQTNKGGNLPGGGFRVVQLAPTNAALWLFQGTPDAPVSPGDYYSGRWQVRWVSGTTASVSARLGWYSASSFISYAGTAVLTPTLPTDGSWVDVVVPAQLPAPTNAVSVRLMMYANGATAPGTTLEVRRVLVEKTPGPVAAASVGPYFDGSTSPDADFTYSWTGTADSSTSTANP